MRHQMNRYFFEGLFNCVSVFFFVFAQLVFKIFWLSYVEVKFSACFFENTY